MFKRGQRVVCIDDTPLPGMSWKDGPKPNVGEIYTVTKSGIPSIYTDEPCCSLAEIPRSMPFLCRRFRPVQERKTDISIFQKILDDVSKGKVEKIDG